MIKLEVGIVRKQTVMFTGGQQWIKFTDNAGENIRYFIINMKAQKNFI